MERTHRIDLSYCAIFWLLPKSCILVVRRPGPEHVATSAQHSH